MNTDERAAALPAVSGAKRAANRANAQQSTGPKTAAGKAASAQNARRHGFSTPVGFEGPLLEPYESLARRLAAGRPDRLAAARAAAELRFNLDRISGVDRRGHRPPAAALANARRGRAGRLSARAAVADELARRERYAKAFRAKWRKAVRALA